MQLTGDGERCYGFARQVLESWSEMEAELLGARDDPRGTLRVQVPHAFGQDQLIAPLGKYLSRYPNVSVEWVLHDRSPNFTAEGIDCAIQAGVIEDPSVVAIRLGEVPRIVVTHPSLAGDGPLPSTTEQLERLPWLALRTYYTDEVVLTCQADGRSHRFAIQPRMSTDSLYALRSAALAGLGACVSSAWVVAQDIEEGRLIQLVPQWRAAPLPVYLIYPHARSYPAKLRLFEELLPQGAAAVAQTVLPPEALAALGEVATRRDLRLLTVGPGGTFIDIARAEPRAEGTAVTLRHGGQTRTIDLPLVGFQADNAVTAAALAIGTGAWADDVFALLPRLAGVRGRVERVAVLPNGAAVYVDYAHTPDAISSVLRAVRPHVAGRLAIVFGAGGDRDPGKRAPMGEAAAVADRAIVTDDNPRSEDPATIRAAVLRGCPGAEEIGDRRAAIAAAIAGLGPGDIAVIAGKGHEQGQIVGDRVIPFDDATVAREEVARLAS